MNRLFMIVLKEVTLSYFKQLDLADQLILDGLEINASETSEVFVYLALRYMALFCCNQTSSKSKFSNWYQMNSLNMLQ